MLLDIICYLLTQRRNFLRPSFLFFFFFFNVAFARTLGVRSTFSILRMPDSEPEPSRDRNRKRRHRLQYRPRRHLFPYGLLTSFYSLSNTALFFFLICTEKVKQFFFNLFIYLWLCWVFVSVRGLSLVVASGGHSSPRCAGLSPSRPLLLRSTGSRRAGSVVVAHGPSRSAARGIFPDRGSNPCPPHWRADS